jgi:hypothetical protein
VSWGGRRWPGDGGLRRWRLGVKEKRRGRGSNGARGVQGTTRVLGGTEEGDLREGERSWRRDGAL